MADNNTHISKKSSLLDGIWTKNTVALSGLVIAPVVFSATTVKNALAIMFVFSSVTLFTILIASFIPRSIVYTIRIILYTLIASLVYVPIISMALQLFPNEVEKVGIMMPLLIANSLILTRTETRFFRESKRRMIADVVSHILGFDLVIIVFAFIREFFGTGMINDKLMGVKFTLPALVYPFAGFILLGLLAALIRAIQSYFSE